MGRPLNKKYFGNKNSPYTEFQGKTGADSGLGGSVASVTVGGTNNNYEAVPAITFAAPTLVGGVTAVAGTVRMVVKSVAIANAGGSYLDEEVVELGDGSLPAGSGTVNGTYATRASFRIKSVGGTGDVTSIELVTGGSYTVLAYNGSTAASAPGSTVTEMYTTGGTGNNLRVTITWGVLSIDVTTAGSGYTSAPAITDDPDGNATLTAVLSVLNGARAIKAFAYLTGGSRLAADIIKQDNDRAYKVENATGVEVVQLVDSEANAAGEMDITATDSAGNAYWVKKLTARKAVLTRKVSGNGQFASGTSVPWTFDAAVENYSVKIDNA